MDLLRTFPPDVNFLEDAEPTEKAKALGFPRKFPHKLVYLRQELVDTFVEYVILKLLFIIFNFLVRKFMRIEKL